MRIVILILIVSVLCVSGCAKPRVPVMSPATLHHGLAAADITAAWGNPTKRLLLGRTRAHRYPVELWEYTLPAKHPFGPRLIMLFVDEELYLWGNPDTLKLSAYLTDLGIETPHRKSFHPDYQHRQLQTITDDAQRIHRTNDLIRQHHDVGITQQHIRDMQQRGILEQQRIYRPPPQPPRQ